MKELNLSELSEVAGGCYCKCWTSEGTVTAIGEKPSISLCADACSTHRGWYAESCK